MKCDKCFKQHKEKKHEKACLSFKSKYQSFLNLLKQSVFGRALSKHHTKLNEIILKTRACDYEIGEIKIRNWHQEIEGNHYRINIRATFKKRNSKIRNGL